MDPAYALVIQLLQSTSKHSTDQLRALLEETIKQRYGDSKSLAPLNIIKDHSKKESIPKYSSSSSSARKDSRGSSTEKKRIDTVVDVIEPGPPVKSPEVVKVKPAIVRELEPVKEVVPVMQVDNDDDEDDDDDDDDLALEILEDDLSCVVCRGMSVGVCNQLVECLECHSLYHQECHQPPVAKADINDPRWAWYCATCTKAINKQPSKSRSSPKTVSSGSSQPSSQASSKSSQKAVQEPVQNLFKRQDSKGNSSSSSKSPITTPSSMGMAGLAASYQPTLVSSSSSSSKSSASSSSSSKVVVPKVVTTVISADKRLANMKRKAAKQQEKRKHIK